MGQRNDNHPAMLAVPSPVGTFQLHKAKCGEMNKTTLRSVGWAVS